MNGSGERSARRERYAALEAGPLDVLIIGGGISGAPIFARLAEAGYRVGLVDRGDFASGTSQASGMLIWGGLLYLKHGDLRTVRKLCMARNRLLEEPGVRPLQFRYRTTYAGGIPRWALQAGLVAYWLLGNAALRPPGLLDRGTEEEAVFYEEAMLEESDSRMVLRMITEWISEHAIAQNYCEVVGARYLPDERLWRVSLCDHFGGGELEVTCRLLVNAAGVWTDRLNERLGIESPYRHRLSKGVYLNFRRDIEQEYAEIYPMPGASDVLTAVPWGPVTMWGPTETPASVPEEAFFPDRDDLHFLTQSARKLWKRELPEIVSLRCGVRPLAVRAGAGTTGSSLAISRRHYLAYQREEPSLVIYGGKLTGSLDLGEEVLRLIRGWMPQRYRKADRREARPQRMVHPAFSQPVVSPEWAREHEQCCTLEDYLRRRTPIAQWVPRMGLGLASEYGLFIRQWAAALGVGEAGVAAYENEVYTRWDSLLHSSL